MKKLLYRHTGGKCREVFREVAAFDGTDFESLGGGGDNRLFQIFIGVLDRIPCLNR